MKLIPSFTHIPSNALSFEWLLQILQIGEGREMISELIIFEPIQLMGQFLSRSSNVIHNFPCSSDIYSFVDNML